VTREKPILFSAPMVRAILAGAKTQTRRVVKPQPPTVESVLAKSGSTYSIFRGEHSEHFHVAGPVWAVREAMGREPVFRSPYGYAGERLWVRETFTHIRGNGIRTWYRADGEPRDSKGEILATRAGEARWFPSIYMPRHESRITLEVTGVRVERLQSVTEDDAKAEGVPPMLGAPEPVDPQYRDGFRQLWDGINGTRPGCAWADNPFVWVVSFKRVKP
jgi:hypothetical protein